jgi:hypothetical protein
MTISAFFGTIWTRIPTWVGIWPLNILSVSHEPPLERSVTIIQFRLGQRTFVKLIKPVLWPDHLVIICEFDVILLSTAMGSPRHCTLLVTIQYLNSNLPVAFACVSYMQNQAVRGRRMINDWSEPIELLLINATDIKKPVMTLKLGRVISTFSWGVSNKKIRTLEACNFISASSSWVLTLRFYSQGRGIIVQPVISWSCEEHVMVQDLKNKVS